MVDDDGRLSVDIEADALPESLTEVEDRIGALGGSLTIRRSTDRCSLRAELPCG
jgi:hypothetical protein